MPGICGVMGRPCVAADVTLDAMTAPLRPHPWFVTESWQEDDASLAAGSLERSQWMAHRAIASDQAFVCVIDGELYNAPEIKRGLDAADLLANGNHHNHTAAEMMLAGRRREGL